MSSDVLLVGGGVFGAAAAISLRARGASVTLVDPGPLPHPDASSTDISKLVRADYGNDVFYTQLMEAAFPAWRAWNDRFGEELFHESGFLVLSGEEMKSGSPPRSDASFERASYDLLRARGHALERLDAHAIHARFPAWNEGAFADGYFNANGGWAESGRVVRALLAEAVKMGVTLREGVRVQPIAGGTTRIDHVTTDTGESIHAGTVVVTAGAFTPVVVPELADRITPIAQVVLHVAPVDASRFSAPAFVPWAADIARTGLYGFPFHEGVVKIAHHGRGTPVNPRAPRVVPEDAEEIFRAFFARALADLTPAPCVKKRVCLYSDSFDGDFFVDRHPSRDGLVVASGGSGHAFKFAPLLGAMIADRVENKGFGEWRSRFAWRERTTSKREAARADA